MRRRRPSMRVYRTLLLMLPGDIRRDFGRDMEQLFADRLHEVRGSRRRIARLWVTATGDVVVTASKEWGARAWRLARGAWGEGTRAEGWARDLRFGARTLRRRPGFTVAAVTTLALGIGANAAIFSVVHTLLLRPLPYPDADRLVLAVSHRLAPAEFAEWKAQATALEDFTGLDLRGGTATGSDGPAERIGFMSVTEDFFDLVGVRPVQGRLLVAGDHDPGAPPVTVVSDELWRARFGTGAAPGEATLTLDGVMYAVVGVLPPGFRFYRYEGVDAYLPQHHYASRGLTAAARLAPGVTFGRADEQFRQIASRYELPAALSGLQGLAADGLEPMGRAAYSHLRRPLLALFGAAAFVLLIGCANVANLLAARATGRRGELAVRRALGAGRATLIRQLLTESALLAGLGAAAGLVVASACIEAMLRIAPGYLPRAEEIGVDGVVLAFTAGVAVGTTLLAGLAPAFGSAAEAGRTASAMKGRATASAARRRWGEGVAVVQIAMALVLSIGTALLVRTYLTLRPSDVAFEVEDRIVAGFDLDAGYEDFGSRRRYAQALLDEIARNVPRERAAIVTDVPLSGGSMLGAVTAAEGVAMERTPDDPLFIHFRSATPNYMRVVEMPVIRGRHLSETALPDAPNEVVINETAARQIFPDGGDPLGRSFTLRMRSFTRSIPDESIRFTTVGVATDTRLHPSSLEAYPEVWASFWQIPWNRFRLVIHDPTGTVSPPIIRAAASAADPDLPVGSIEGFEQIAREAVEEPRFQMTLMTIFAALALALALIGCYSVLAFAVGQRTREMGIRIALGAGESSITRLVLRRGLLIAVIGVTFGLLLTAGLSRMVAAMLYGVSPTDPATFVGAALLLGGVALLAAYLPARRAARVDPMASLRAE